MILIISSNFSPYLRKPRASGDDPNIFEQIIDGQP